MWKLWLCYSNVQVCSEKEAGCMASRLQGREKSRRNEDNGVGSKICTHQDNQVEIYWGRG